MKLEDVISTHRLVEFCQSHGISYLAVFGSMATGDASESSDVDLLVKFQRRVSLIRHVQVQQELEELMGRRVDLLTVESLHPRLRDRILTTKKVIYDEVV